MRRQSTAIVSMLLLCVACSTGRSIHGHSIRLYSNSTKLTFVGPTRPVKRVKIGEKQPESLRRARERLRGRVRVLYGE
jgi:hypothetical protein